MGDCLPYCKSERDGLSTEQRRQILVALESVKKLL
jgi:hypothetical protein